MDRHECANVLAGLLTELGWAREKTEDADAAVQDDVKGVTVLSHSK